MANSPKIPGVNKTLEGSGGVSGPLQHAELAKTNEKQLVGGLSKDMQQLDYFAGDGGDPNWVWSTIDGANWNKSFPFQLSILMEEGFTVSRKGNTRYPSFTVDRQFTLPIPPSDLSISTPFAITTSVTLGGIIEEHNGAPLRSITFSGTTGVYPLRGTTATLPTKSDAKTEFLGIAAGTIAAVGNLVNQSLGVANTASSLLRLPSNSQNSPNLLHENDFQDLNSQSDIKSSGYYQFRLLQRFLERYSNLKKTKDGQKYRLALSIWKDNATYLVTPRSFDVRRSASSPFEYNYTISLLAWARIDLSAQRPVSVDGYKPVIQNPGVFRQLLNTIQASRRVLHAATGVMNAFAGDLENLVFEPLRGISLFCKDLLGVGITAAELPKNIQKKFERNWREIRESWVGVSKTNEFRTETSVDYGESSNDYYNERGSLQGSSGDGGNNSSNEVVKLLSDLNRNFVLAEAIRPSELNLAPSIEAEILEERRRVRLFDRAYFEKIRDQIAEFSANFANTIGAGSESFNSIAGLAPQSNTATAANREPTEEEYEALFALNSVGIELNRLAASGLIDNDTFTTMEVTAGMASRSGIAFNLPASKFAVPFPYGVTLERLAVQYLGDANRWHEIAALNGLKHPYVDEEGFQLPLLVNGNRNQVVVAQSLNLFVGQAVWLSSNSTSRSKRKITKIDSISPTSVALTLDGDADLDRYKVLSGAYLHAFLPDTVNSQMTIYIPSTQPSQEDDFRTKSIPGLDEQDPYLRAGGVDLLLTQDGDLAVTQDGDCRLAIGLTNLIQRLRIALETPKGSLVQHPEFGLGLSVGMSTADLNPNELKSAVTEIVKADGGFSGVQSAAILKQGPVAQIFLSVGVAGTSQFIPISFQVKK